MALLTLRCSENRVYCIVSLADVVTIHRGAIVQARRICSS